MNIMHYPMAISKFLRLLIFSSLMKKEEIQNLTCKINGKKIKQMGICLHNKEFSNNLIKAGFEIIKIYPLNYKNGKVMNNFKWTITVCKDKAMS